MQRPTIRRLLGEGWRGGQISIWQGVNLGQATEKFQVNEARSSMASRVLVSEGVTCRERGRLVGFELVNLREREKICGGTENRSSGTCSFSPPSPLLSLYFIILLLFIGGSTPANWAFYCIPTNFFSLATQKSKMRNWSRKYKEKSRLAMFQGSLCRI